MYKIYAGIISYNPDMDKLKRNISSVLPQVDGLVMVDNGSDNLQDIKTLISQAGENLSLIENQGNKGVAYGLNQIMAHAEKAGVNWVLTLDDDSECYPGLIGMYRELIDSNRVDKLASITCLRKDRKYEEAEPVSQEGYTLVDICITSGNLVLVDAWMNVKGFNNKLFIDMVDDDFCYRLRRAGYNIARINQYGYLHELGNDLIKVKVFGREKTVFAYSPMRKYYTARNVRYMIRTYKLGIFNEYSSYLFKRVMGTLLYEKNKIKGLSAYLKGYKAGKKL